MTFEELTKEEQARIDKIPDAWIEDSESPHYMLECECAIYGSWKELYLTCDITDAEKTLRYYSENEDSRDLNYYIVKYDTLHDYLEEKKGSVVDKDLARERDYSRIDYDYWRRAL